MEHDYYKTHFLENTVCRVCHLLPLDADDYRSPCAGLPVQDAIDAARDLGVEAGNSAASWVFDGNTTEETYRTILKWIEDGDPEKDSIEPSFASAREVCDEVGIDYDLIETDEQDKISDAYNEEALNTFWFDVERLARQAVS